MVNRDNNLHIGTSGDREETPFKRKSSFLPSANLNSTILTYSKLVEKDLSELVQTSHPVRYNLSKAEKTALKNLESRKDIIILPADKGGAVVVMGFQQYNQNILSQLSAREYYTPLKSNPTETFKCQIHEHILLAHERNWITQKERDFLLVEHPVCPVFYGLPKVHKCAINPPLRPTVASIGSLTEPLSQFVDFFIKKFVSGLPSFLEDTVDILNIIKECKCEQNDIFVTVDVQSLYTCIPHEAGIDALSHYLENRTPGLLPTNEFLLTLSQIILTINFFKYCDSYFLQCCGTAMGSAFAPSYACLVMGFWEEKFIDNPIQNVFLSRIVLWKRFIDDVFMIWRGDQNDLNDFLKYLNSTTNYLSFTMEQNDSSIHFLDLTLFKGEDNSIGSIFRKPLSRNTLLKADSNHQKQLIQNIPIGQFLRLRRNCSNIMDFQCKAIEMKDRFQQRGYPTSKISLAYQRALGTERESLLVKKPKSSSTPRIVFSTEYSPLAGRVKNIIHKHWNILKSNPTLNSISSTPPLITFRRSCNLRDRLVHSETKNMPSKVSWLPNQPQGFYRRGHCAQCSNSSDIKYVTHPRTGKKSNSVFYQLQQ